MSDVDQTRRVRELEEKEKEYFMGKQVLSETKSIKLRVLENLQERSYGIIQDSAQSNT